MLTAKQEKSSRKTGECQDAGLSPRDQMEECRVGKA